MIRLLLSAFAVVIATTTAAFAQAPSNGSTFRLLSLIGSHYDLKYEPAPGRKPVSLVFAQTISSPYPAPASRRLEVFREIPPPPDAPPGTPPKREIVLTANLPTEVASCLVVSLAEATAPRGPFKSLVIPEDPNHRAGTFHYVNLSKFPASLAVAKSTYDLSSGDSLLVSLNPGRVRVFFQAAIQSGGRWESIFKGERRVNTRARGYVFITDYIQDPDYEADLTPPPALARLIFEPDPVALSPSPKPASKPLP